MKFYETMKIILIANIIITVSLFSQSPVYYNGFPKIIDSIGVPSTLSRTPLITDFEKDGQKEIVFVTIRSAGNFLYVIKSDGSNLFGFPKIINNVIHSISSGDVDGNGILDIVVRTSTQVTVIDKAGNNLPGFPVNYSDNISGSGKFVSLYDLDNNGQLEIIVNKLGEICVFNYDGTIRSGWPKGIIGQADACPAIGDIDIDGYAEIILATYKQLSQPPYSDSSALRIYRSDGSNFSNDWPIYYDSNYFAWDSSPTLFIHKSNIDSTFILTSQNGETINSYEKSRNVMYDIYGNVKSQSHIMTYGNAPGTLVLGDINRDGILEFVNGEQADQFDISLYAYSNHLQVLNGWPGKGGGAHKSTPIIGKFTFGSNLNVLANTWSATVDSGGFIYGSNYNGSQLPWSPLRPIGLVQAISTADLNNDGSVELIAISTRTSSETYLHIWSFPGIPYSNEDFPWPQYGHDRYRTNQYGFIPPDGPISIQPIGSNVPVSFVLYQNYPNPFNPLTNVRFDISAKSIVSLIVYDILGREVTVLLNEEVQAGEYRISWDASDFSSGVYFIRMSTGEFSDHKKLILLK